MNEIKLIGAGDGYHLDKSDRLYEVARNLGAERIELWHDGVCVDRWEIDDDTARAVCELCHQPITGEAMTIGLPEPDGQHVTYIEPVCNACHTADATSPEGLVRWGTDGVETVPRFATVRSDGTRVYLSAEFGSAAARDEAMAAAQQSGEYRTHGWRTMPVG